MTDDASSTPTPIRPNVLTVGVVLAVLAGFGWWVSGIGLDDDNRTGPSVVGESVIEEFPVADRDRQDDVTGRTLDGATYGSSDLLGQVVVYNVWGSWCAPCVKEAPDLVEVANQYAEKATFVGLNVRDDDASARAFERNHEVPYDSVVSDDSGNVMLSFGTALTASAVPSTMIVDRAGRVAARVVGSVTAATLRALLDAVVAESGN